MFGPVISLSDKIIIDFCELMAKEPDKDVSDAIYSILAPYHLKSEQEDRIRLLLRIRAHTMQKKRRKRRNKKMNPSYLKLLAISEKIQRGEPSTFQKVKNTMKGG